MRRGLCERRAGGENRAEQSRAVEKFDSVSRIAVVRNEEREMVRSSRPALSLREPAGRPSKGQTHKSTRRTHQTMSCSSAPLPPSPPTRVESAAPPRLVARKCACSFVRPRAARLLLVRAVLVVMRPREAQMQRGGIVRNPFARAGRGRRRSREVV